MYEGESYGASGTSTQTTDQGTQTPKAAQAQAGQVLSSEPIQVTPQTGPVPEKEVGTELNAHDAAQQDKGIAYKKIESSLFCFDCGRKAEYFAVYFGKWEKYLCAEDMQKELVKAEAEGVQSQQGSTQPPPQTPVEPPK